MVDLATRRFLARYPGDGFNMRSSEKVGCFRHFSSIHMRVMIVTLEPLDGRVMAGNMAQGHQLYWKLV